MPLRLRNYRLHPALKNIMRSLVITSLSDRPSVLCNLHKFVLRMVHQTHVQTSLHSEHGLGKKDASCYKDSVKTLNTLQSNASLLEKAKIHPILAPLRNSTIAWLTSLRITLDDLDKLNIIHVSGTKGKGSTCAFCESILRKLGLRTGFYSSPHVIAVRERIRINGQPLSESAFASYFWEVYDQLSAFRDNSEDSSLPPYFAFLTLMAFHVFLKEKVDVAIVEVGIGGQYDTTNIVRKPVVCGVTSLGMDHLSILGSTLPQIAWQKAGIFKLGVPAVTVQQKKEAMNVLIERANEIGAPLSIARPLDSYNWHDLPQVLGLEGETQRINAALAVHLVLTWFQKRCSSNLASIAPESHNTPLYVSSYDFMSRTSAGLRDCRWPGRYQILHRENVTYFMDGAHTPESMELCAKWFDKSSKYEIERLKTDYIFRVLLFNSTGDRSAESLLSSLVECGFTLAMFCPNEVTTVHDSSSDMAHMGVSIEKLIERCETNENVWQTLHFRSDGKEKFPTEVVSCVSEALELLSGAEQESFFIKRLSPLNGKMRSENVKYKIHVLVVGSLHLVGGVLSILDPNLENK